MTKSPSAVNFAMNFTSLRPSSLCFKLGRIAARALPRGNCVEAFLLSSCDDNLVIINMPYYQASSLKN
jgi:hypothetical protein